MRLILFLLMLLVKPAFGQEQAVVWTKGIAINLEENEIWNVDIMNNLILTRRNIIEKYDSSGVLKFSQSIRSMGQLAELEPLNFMKIYAFSEEQQVVCVFDNTLTLSEKCLDLSEFGIGMAVHIASSIQSDRIWVLDQLNSRLLSVKTGRTANSQEVKNLGGILNIQSISGITEYNNELYLTDYEKGVYRFDLYGSLIDFYPVESCDQLLVIDGNMLTLCSGKLRMLELYTGKSIEIDLPLSNITSFRALGNSFWFHSENKVINYRLSLAD
jgi:hypothetical protein